MIGKVLGHYLIPFSFFPGVTILGFTLCGESCSVKKRPGRGADMTRAAVRPHAQGSEERASANGRNDGEAYPFQGCTPVPASFTGKENPQRNTELRIMPEKIGLPSLSDPKGQ
ncbi:hypothetical protein DVQ04_07870 [Yersinia enterocolitica]|nr:hypothetical protein [Yersinia enterocolitica]EKN6091071.1 hypothetical protein [Yersinia enterocolitica]